MAQVFKALAACSILALAACDNPQSAAGPTARGSDGNFTRPVVSPTLPRPSISQADAFAVTYLNTIQPRTLRDAREYCGYFRVAEGGGLEGADVSRGSIDSCPRTPPPSGTYAAWHTHGAWDLDYDTEVPSPQDMIGTTQSGIDGYLATPGGRVWRIDAASQTAFLICENCVTADPAYDPRQMIPVRSTYTLQSLQARYATALGIGRTIITN